MTEKTPAENTIVEGEGFRCSLAEFFESNADGIDQAQQADIVADLVSIGRAWEGPGGSSGWAISVSKDEIDPRLNADDFRNGIPTP